MQTVLHRAETRGQAEWGWLSSRHTFSFGGYRDSERTRFGLLRVINDDLIQPGTGFDTHPHENMEIVSIPLIGELRHIDSMGNTQLIRQGEVQIMSAGSGLTHSEYNASEREVAGFLQIWVFPKVRDIEPRYDQKAFLAADRVNRLQNIVSPNADDGGVQINQDAWFWLGDFAAGERFSYATQGVENGIYVFVIDGELTVAGETLGARDGLGITDSSVSNFEVVANTKVLIMDVPL